MHAYRGRGGPSRSTPSSVQCQKCLKRGHYSYECKSSAQERPYVSRPSRTQQLRNPKLVPKLTEDTPNILEKKKGLADEELAKREAERARKRELDGDEDDEDSSAMKRRRSVSSESVSSISTNASCSKSPDRRGKVRSPPVRKRAVSTGSISDDAQRSKPAAEARSASPHRRHRSRSRDSLSPRREQDDRSYRSRETPPRYASGDRQSRHRRRDSSVSQASHDLHHRNRELSRTPEAERRRHGRLRHEGKGRQNPDYNSTGRRHDSPPVETPRERSLSPFSKRLALTQSGNGGRR